MILSTSFRAPLVETIINIQDLDGLLEWHQVIIYIRDVSGMFERECSILRYADCYVIFSMHSYMV